MVLNKKPIFFAVLFSIHLICGLQVTFSSNRNSNSGSRLPPKIVLFAPFESPLKMMNNAFYFIFKAFFVLKIYLSFCHDFLVMLKKRLDWRDQVNFKIHDVTTLLANNYNTHIARYLMKQKQPDNETWSIKKQPDNETWSIN